MSEATDIENLAEMYLHFDGLLLDAGTVLCDTAPARGFGTAGGPDHVGLIQYGPEGRELRRCYPAIQDIIKMGEGSAADEETLVVRASAPTRQLAAYVSLKIADLRWLAGVLKANPIDVLPHSFSVTASRQIACSYEAYSLHHFGPSANVTIRVIENRVVAGIAQLKLWQFQKVLDGGRVVGLTSHVDADTLVLDNKWADLRIPKDELAQALRYFRHEAFAMNFRADLQVQLHHWQQTYKELPSQRLALEIAERESYKIAPGSRALLVRFAKIALSHELWWQLGFNQRKIDQEKKEAEHESAVQSQ